MRRVAFQIWVHFCSLMVAAPVGWCCWLPDLRAQDAAEDAAQCCCGDRAAPKPEKPAKPANETPGSTCCCEPLPAVTLTPDERRPGDDADATDCVLLSPWAPAGFHSITHPVPIAFAYPSLPLHVLHCVWLC